MKDEWKAWPTVTGVLRPFFERVYGVLEDGNRYPCPWCGGFYGGNEYVKRGHFVGDAMDVLVSGCELTDEALAWFNKHEQWIPYLEAGRKYLRENPPQEQPVTQLRLVDKLQKVTGKPDWIWKHGRKITDVKTGSGEPPEWLSLQTGEYAVLAHQHFGHAFEHRELLWLKPDGEYRVIVHDGALDALDFNDLLRAEWVRRVRLG